MKILIFVQGCDDAPYLEMNEWQIATWDNIKVLDVETIFYLSSKEKEYRFTGIRLYVPCSEAYDMMHWRFKLALDFVWDMDWDIMFRTNSSSYVDKQMLKDFALSLPKEKVYCGIDGGGFASGSGVFITRDYLQFIRDEFDNYPTPSEDCAIGTVLAKKGIKVTPGAQRFDYWFNDHSTLPRVYHYRCKSNDNDRGKDIIAFKHIYSFLHG